MLLILWLQSELRITLKSSFAFVPQHWQGVAQLWFFWGLGLAWFAFWWHFLSTGRAPPTVQQCLGIQSPRSSWALCKRFLWSNNGSLPKPFSQCLLSIHAKCFKCFYFNYIKRTLWRELRETIFFPLCSSVLHDSKQTHNKDKSLAKRHDISISSHLYLLIAGRELSLLEDHDMVTDPLEQKSH